MKTIKMKSTMAGPEGVTLAGQVIEVDDQKAEALIGGGYAIETAEKLPKAEKVARSKRRGGGQSLSAAANEEV